VIERNAAKKWDSFGVFPVGFLLRSGSARTVPAVSLTNSVEHVTIDLLGVGLMFPGRDMGSIGASVPGQYLSSWRETSEIY